jgi:hypothetical protein
VIARHFLRGQGLEIGALHNPLVLPPGAAARYVDVAPIEVLAGALPRGRGQDPARPTSWTTASCWHVRGATRSLDFVVANHLLEHCEDPIGTRWRPSCGW